MFPDVFCHLDWRTWHTLRAPRTWRTWRGWSTWHTWRMWSPRRIWRTKRAWHAWDPGAPGAPGARGELGTHGAPRERRAPGNCIGSQWLSIRWRPLNMLSLGCYLCGGRAGESERDGLRLVGSLTPPPSPIPVGLGEGRGGRGGVRASKMAQDGSKMASESPRWPPRSLKIAQHGSR